MFWFSGSNGVLFVVYVNMRMAFMIYAWESSSLGWGIEFLLGEQWSQGGSKVVILTKFYHNDKYLRNNLISM